MRRIRTGAVAAGLLALLATAPCVATAGVTVSLSPTAQTVAPGGLVDVNVVVTAGSAFNAFDLMLQFDPAALTPVPLSPISGQFGALMTGACGSQFHRFMPGAGADTVNYGMLCAGATTSGPGTIYKLRFRASSTPQPTTVRMLSAGTKFYNAGLFVLPVTTHDAAIGIGQTVTLGVEANAPAPALAVTPNPCRAAATLSFGAALADPARVTIHDALGRRVRELEAAAGARALEWDLLAGDGTRVRPGLYLVTLRHGGAETHGRLVVVR